MATRPARLELRAAGVEAASAVVIALGNDLENLAALIRVGRLNPRARVVVLVHHEDLTDVLKSAGANRVVRARRYLGRMPAGLAVSGNLGGVLLESTEASSRALRRHGYALGFFVVGGSRCDGAGLSELPGDVTPVLVERDGKFTPHFSKDFQPRAGDGLVVIGDPHVAPSGSAPLSRRSRRPPCGGRAFLSSPKPLTA